MIIEGLRNIQEEVSPNQDETEQKQQLIAKFGLRKFSRHTGDRARLGIT